MNLTIITDGNLKFGLGHILRSKTLAKFLMKDGHEVELIILSEINLKTLYVYNDVVIDVPYEGDFLLTKINPKSKVIGLDYIGQSNLDLVVNVFDFNRYKGANQNTGLKYAIIREDVVSLIEKKIYKRDKVLVMLGSFDKNKYAYDVIRFTDINKLPTSFIEKEKSIDISFFEYCTHFENPKNLASIMNESAWAISNGGSTMLELMSLGIAVHVLPQTKAEMALAEKIFNQNALLGVGMPIDVPDNNLIRNVEIKAQNVVDGFGVNRVVQLIKEVVND